MVLITLTLSQPNITGVFSATARASFDDGTGKIVTQIPYTANIVSSTASLDLPRSDDKGITYLFEAYRNTTVNEYYLQSGQLYTGAFFTHTDNKVYTGQAPYTAGVNQLLTLVQRTVRSDLIKPFDGLVPNTPTNVLNLLDIGVTDKQLEYSAWRVSDLLSSVPLFRNRLPKGLTFLGNFNPLTTYTRDNAIFYGGSLWGYISDSNFAGVTPGSNAAIWSKVVEPPANAIAAASAIGWNRTTWLLPDYQGQAAPRSDLVAMFDSIPSPDLSAYPTKSGDNTFAGINLFPTPAASPPTGQVIVAGWADGRYGRVNAVNTWGATNTFNGAVIVQDRNAGDSSQNAANTKFVIGEFNSRNLGNLPAPISDVARNTAQALTINPTLGDVVIWNSFVNAGFFNSVGDFIVPAGVPTDTRFLFQGLLTFTINMNFSSGGDRRLLMRIFGSVGSVDIGNCNALTVNTMNASGVIYTLPFSRIFRLSANQTFQIRAAIVDTQGGTVTAAALTASAANNYLTVHRVN